MDSGKQATRWRRLWLGLSLLALGLLFEGAQPQVCALNAMPGVDCHFRGRIGHGDLGPDLRTGPMDALGQD